MTPYDNAPPGSPPRGEPASAPVTPSLRRGGSQKRQRRCTVKSALTAAEFAEAQAKAQACGLSLSSFSRASMLGVPGPRAQRAPHVNTVELAKATAALNKVGSNLNQIAHVLNASGPIGMAREYLAVLAEVRAAARAIRESVGRKDRP